MSVLDHQVGIHKTSAQALRQDDTYRTFSRTRHADQSNIIFHKFLPTLPIHKKIAACKRRSSVLLSIYCNAAAFLHNIMSAVFAELLRIFTSLYFCNNFHFT